MGAGDRGDAAILPFNRRTRLAGFCNAIKGRGLTRCFLMLPARLLSRQTTPVDDVPHAGDRKYPLQFGERRRLESAASTEISTKPRNRTVGD